MDAAQRQAARGLLDMAAQRYIPPELRGLLGLVAEANPVVSMERAGTAAQGLLGRQATPMQRVGYAGDMLSNMAGVVAPAMVASRAGLPAAQALQESVMGFSQAAGIPEFIADESGALRLYHGSPHDFDKFSMDKIGTGEGAQAYGHGLYFAESEGVAKSYRDALAQVTHVNGVPLDDLAAEARGVAPKLGDWGTYNLRALKSGQVSDESVVAAYIGDYGDPQKAISHMWEDDQISAADLAQKWLREGRLKERGHMYEVEVNANPEDFLDWDKPLSEQPQKVREALDAVKERYGLFAGQGTRGQGFYEEASDVISPTISGSDAAASSALREAGIPGIRYLDAGSRGAGDGSRNYVVFDENLISIVRKYGIAGAAALYGVSQADIAQAMNPTTDRQTGLLMAQTPPRAD